MGFLDKATGGLIGGGAGSALFGPVGGVIGGGLGLVSGAGGLFSGAGGLLKNFFGQRDSGIGTEIYPVDPDIKKTQDIARRIQRLGMEKLEEADASFNPEEIAQKEANIAFSAIKDQRRALQDRIARLGLQGTSVGLARTTGLEREGVEAGANIMSGIQARIANLKSARAQNLIGGAGSVLGLPGLQQTIVPGNAGTGVRQGGLMSLAMPIAGAVIGGMSGAGPLGALAGWQIGSGASNIMSTY